MGGGRLILLDTHALVWLDQDASDLGPEARALADAALRDDALGVSAISFWEVAMLASRGRVELALPIATWRRELIDRGLVEYPVDGEVAIAAVELPGLHPDPADRMIAATTHLLGATLITADARLLRWQGALERHDARR